MTPTLPINLEDLLRRRTVEGERCDCRAVGIRPRSCRISGTDVPGQNSWWRQRISPPHILPMGLDDRIVTPDPTHNPRVGADLCVSHTKIPPWPLFPNTGRGVTIQGQDIANPKQGAHTGAPLRANGNNAMALTIRRPRHLPESGDSRTGRRSGDCTGGSRTAPTVPSGRSAGASKTTSTVWRKRVDDVITIFSLFRENAEP